MMNLNKFQFLLLLLGIFGSLKAQLPVAGFTIGTTQIIPMANAPNIGVTVTNTSTGSPTSVTYYFHDPGGPVISLYGSQSTTDPTALLDLNDPYAPACLPFALSQVVSNSFGSDTLTTVFNVGCPCLTVPVWYNPTITYNGNGSITINALSNENSYIRNVTLVGYGSNYAPATWTVSGPGNYSYCVTYVYGTCSGSGGYTTCGTFNVPCPGPPTALFGQSTNQNIVTFNDLSQGWPAVTPSWDFGDGTTGTGFNPSHAYTAPGTYLVCYTVSNVCGQDTFCSSVTINCPATVASFSSTTSNLQVSFANGSSGIGTISYNWDFGNGDSSNVQNPSYSYALPGQYLVCLTATDTCGQSTYCDSVTVSCPAPAPSFSYTQNQFAASFTASTFGSGPYSWAWDFGDGNSSSLQNPTHTYSMNGVYPVCLTVSDLCGATVVCDTVVVNLASLSDPAGSGMVIFPNPASERVQIDLGGPLPEDGMVVMLNASGQEILRKPARSGEVALSLEMGAVPDGLYLLQIQGGKVRRYAKLLIAR